MTPTEKHRETAKHLASIQCGADDQCHDGSPCICRDNIARALANAEREGMKRAAEIANKHHECERDCGDVIRAAILSECGEGA